MHHRSVFMLMALALAAPLASAQVSVDAPESWGVPIPETPAVALDTALAGFNPDHAAPGVYQGRIVDVCEARGCWAMLELNGQSARVMPREHGFMLPRDLRGEARVYGVLISRDLREASARYAAEHPGKPNPIPEQEYRIDALGVALVE